MNKIEMQLGEKLFSFASAANNADRHEVSMKKIGEYAAVHLGSFCNDLKEDV